MNNATKVVKVAITSDLMCPWCWVGLRKLQQASKATQIDIVIEWKPFMLRPNIPEEGQLKSDPTPETRVGRHLKAAGQSVGIDFTGLTDRTPNTALFHAVLHLLQDELRMDHKVVTAYHEAVFEGYFTTSIFPDDNGLLKAAHKVNDQAVTKAIESLLKDKPKLEQLKQHVREEARAASMRGISGVPSFSFNDEASPAFSGAQPVETFAHVLQHYASQKQEA